MKKQINKAITTTPPPPRTKSNKKDLLLTTLFLFLFLFLINLLFPYICDDMIAIYSENANSFESLIRDTFFNRVNGRYIGNVLFLLPKIPILCAFQKSITMTGIIFIINKIINNSSLSVYIITAISIIYPCNSIFSEVYSFSAGFENYVVPVFLFLICIYILSIIKNNKNYRIILCILLTILSFIAQFFSENSSLFFVAISAILFIKAIIKDKKVKIQHFLMLLSTTAGFIIMMILPKIISEKAKNDTYRSIAVSPIEIVKTSIYNYRSFSDCMCRCFLLWSIISIAVILFINKNNLPLKKLTLPIKFVLIIYPFYGIYTEFFLGEFVTPHFHIKTLLNMSFFPVYLICIAIVFIIAAKSKMLYKTEKKFICLMFAGIISFLPLLIVSPIGGRTFYITYVCFFIAAIVLFKKYVPKNILEQKYAKIISLSCITALFVVLTFTCADIKSSEITRNKYLESEIEKGVKEISIPLLPHQNLLHGDLSYEHWEYYFNFKDTPNTKFSFMPWDAWAIEKNNLKDR